MGKRRIIDLSVSLNDTPPGYFPATEVKSRVTHEENAKNRAKQHNCPLSFFPDNLGAAYEIIQLNAHSGTHLDSPWHYGPTSEGKPSKTIDEIPLEWCYGDGVVLDFSHMKAMELISVAHLKEALDKIEYTLKPSDIVLIRTDASKHYLEPEYATGYPGMGRESTFWLIDQGIKMMGIDAKGWDRPSKVQFEEAKKRGWVRGDYWEAHFAGREREYCHIENLANLDAIPVPHGFMVAVFPIKLERFSGGWVRAVAILED